jgi:hypothetical protein
MSTSTNVRLIRGSVQGTVYLVNPINGNVYTFNPEKPTFVGTLEKCTTISKSDGALAGFKVNFRHDIHEVMERLVREKESKTLTAKGGAGV